MKKTVILARIRPNGVLERTNSNGGEEVLPEGAIALKPEQAVEAQRGPDTLPLSTEDLGSMRGGPHLATLRGALGLTQEEFATRYYIPLGTVRDWEQERSEPDQPMCAYLTVIARHPEIVRHALQRRTRAIRRRAESQNRRI